MGPLNFHIQTTYQNIKILAQTVPDQVFSVTHALHALDWTGQTDRAKPIWPFKFFEVGGIKIGTKVSHVDEEFE